MLFFILNPNRHLVSSLWPPCFDWSWLTPVVLDGIKLAVCTSGECHPLGEHCNHSTTSWSNDSNFYTSLPVDPATHQTLYICRFSKIFLFGMFEWPPHHNSILHKCSCVFCCSWTITLLTDSFIVRGDFVEVAESQRRLRILPSLSARE